MSQQAQAAPTARRGGAVWALVITSVAGLMAALDNLVVTTALPYANAPFHVGHMMEYIQADIWVRMQRMVGSEVHFVCADDAHGAPITMRLYLSADGQPLSETWLYEWVPPPLADRKVF